MSADGGRLHEIMSFERQVWDALVAGDSDADRELMHPRFLGVYSTGFATRNDHADLGPDNAPRFSSYRISEERCVEVSDAAVLVAYRAEYQTSEDAPTSAMYVSSLWVDSDGRWVNLFSQDTPITE